MLKISSNSNVYNNYCNSAISNNYKSHVNFEASNMTQSPINLNNQPSCIAFKGFSPDANLRYGIKKFVELVKNPEIKKIAIMAHSCPDCDAIGSQIALKNIIKEATGKDADVFVMNKLPANAEFLNKDGKQIKCLHEIFHNPNNEHAKIMNSEITEKFGKYDLAIVTDSSYKSRTDKKLHETILKDAKKIVKIDHHPSSAVEDLKEEYKYGDINIIDTKKESASQIIMQLVKPFGLDPKHINPKITDAISAGIITDSGQFAYAKGSEIFKDAAKLQKTSNLSKVQKEVSTLIPDEFILLADIMKSVKFNDDKSIAYFVIDRNEKRQTKNATVAALTQISHIKGIKYYFSVHECQKEPTKVTCSLRSNDKSIKEIANKFNGGGHALACGLSAHTDNTNSFIQALIKELKDLTNS